MAGTVQERLQSIISKANATTGKTDADVTAATQSLIDGFGGGGSNPLDYATSFVSMFAGATFPAGYEMVISTNFGAFYRAFENATGIKKVKITITDGADVNCVNLFKNAPDIEEVNFAEMQYFHAREMDYAFKGCRKLKRILGVIDMEGTKPNVEIFRAGAALTHIRFKPNSITENIDFYDDSGLDESSIRSIADGLIDLSGQETKTVTFYKVPIPADVRTHITEKNWTISGA